MSICITQTNVNKEVGEMELSQAVLDGLTLAGDSAHIPDKSFQVLVTRALDGLLDERHRNLVSSKNFSFPRNIVWVGGEKRSFSFSSSTINVICI